MNTWKKVWLLNCQLALGVVVIVCPVAFAAKETALAGTQVVVARPTAKPVTIDGLFGASEWSAAIPVHVDGNQPGGAPGVVPHLPFLPLLLPPDSAQDSSFTIYTLYDKDSLYVAVDVVDDVVINDGPVPFLDDDVEVMIDGDRQPEDVHFAIVCGPANPNCPNPVANNEGFKLTISAGGDTLIDPANNPRIVWESKVGPRSRGFLAEFRIPLQSINTIDTSWFSNGNTYGAFRQPHPGDIIGFNVSVGDDDNGGLSYLRSEPAAHTDSFTAWDGRSEGWYVFAERDWGNLYFALD
jgi:hypothetical protein